MSLTLRRRKINVVGKERMIRLLLPLPKLGRRRQIDIAEHGLSLHGFGVLLPHSIRQHLHHHGSKWFVLRFSDDIEQGGETQPCGPSTDLWQLELGVAVRIM